MKTVRYLSFLVAAIAACACFLPAAPAAAAGEEQRPIFVAGQDGYHTYRIPSIIATAKGSVLAFCEGRKNGGGDSGDIDLLVKRSEDGGRTFSPQQIVWDDGPNTCGNPCAVVDRADGTIWLFMTHNRGDEVEKQIYEGTSRGTRTVWVTKSTDDGRTWSKPLDVTAAVKKPGWTWYATGPGCGIQLRCGRLLIPCDHMTAGKKEYFSHVVYSDDHGKTWQLGGDAGPQTNECEAAELSDGRVMLNMRNYDPAARARAISFSDDRGETWSKVAHDRALVEPICQASLRRYSLDGKDGREKHLLFSNPADKNARAKMTVRLSRDDGRTWPHKKLLHDGPAAYSCLAVLPDGRILCLYERGEKRPYETITLASFTLEQIASEPEANDPKDKKDKNDKKTPLGAALKWIPADAAFYISFLRNREQIETVAASRAWAQLCGLPLCREIERLQSHPAVQAAWEIGRARLSQSAPAVDQAETILKHPQTQRFLEFLADVSSDEVFAYGDRNFVDLMARDFADPLGGEKAPGFVLGCKIRDRYLAAEHLGKLELILGLACMTKPEFKGRMGRERIDGVSYLTFKLDAHLLSASGMNNLSSLAASPKKEGETPDAKPGPTTVVACGIKGGYLLVSLGASTAPLKQLAAADKGETPRLIDRPQMKPLVAALDEKRLTSIAYRSRELNEAVCDRLCPANKPLPAPNSGAIVAFNLMTAQGVETYCYDYSEHPWIAGCKPLELLDHAGGRPLFLTSFRAGFGIAQYDLLVARLSAAYDRFEDRVLWKLNPDCRKRCRLTVALLRPLLRQIDRINREVLIPTLQDGQLLFVVNGGGPALVADVTAAERLRTVYEEYFTVYRDVSDALADVRTSELPDFNAAQPFVAANPLPDWMSLGLSDVGRSGRVVILAASPSAAKKLLESTTPALGNMPVKADHSRATVSFVDCAALVDRASPGVKRAAAGAARWIFADSHPAAAEKQALLHADALLECLKVLRSVARETYVENGAVVTHTFWEIRDVD